MSELMKLREDHAKIARQLKRLGEIVELPQPPNVLELLCIFMTTRW